VTWAVFRKEHNQAIVTLVMSDTPHATAILGGALLEETLTKTLAKRLRNDGDGLNKLTKPGGPMGFAVPKIDMLYMLQAIDRTTRNGLQGLAEVRNYFAHNIDATFDSQNQKMVEAMAKLKMHDGLTHFATSGLQNFTDSSFLFGGLFFTTTILDIPEPFGSNEFSFVLRTNLGSIEVSKAPVPAALPLFASGLGLMGLVGWWKKRKDKLKNAAALAAA
jgi:hypothetical protein